MTLPATPDRRAGLTEAPVSPAAPPTGAAPADFPPAADPARPRPDHNVDADEKRPNPQQSDPRQSDPQQPDPAQPNQPRHGLAQPDLPQPDLPQPDPLRPDLSTGSPRSADDARRQNRRARAAARWDVDIETPRQRLRAWVNMLAVDHGAIRLLHLNLHPIGPRAFRAAQPAPHQIIRLARRAGLKTVVSLRGGVLFGSYPLEREACARAGVDFQRAVLRSRDLPSREELAALIDLIGRVETPVLFHCKSGADRAGFMAALWRIVADGRPAAEAAGQLSLRYGHLKRGPTGILDLFFAEAAAAEAAGVPFARWAAEHYDRDALRERFRRSPRGGGIWRWLTDRVLRRE